MPDATKSPWQGRSCPLQSCQELSCHCLLRRARRQLPRELPPPMTVYGIYRRWVRDGSRQRLHDALRD
ncbi:transposase [Streptomyces sp. LBUM 1476]|nr:transposase [Streptomyces sp. LBUM 1476]